LKRIYHARQRQKTLRRLVASSHERLLRRAVWPLAQPLLACPILCLIMAIPFDRSTRPSLGGVWLIGWAID
jgi:hypothetical protein